MKRSPSVNKARGDTFSQRMLLTVYGMFSGTRVPEDRVEQLHRQAEKEASISQQQYEAGEKTLAETQKILQSVR